MALYRIYQQAMNNVYRHTKAGDLWVRFVIDPRQILFEIEDNGQDIPNLVDWDSYAYQGHLGLIGMEERAEAVGEACSFYHSLAKGQSFG